MFHTFRMCSGFVSSERHTTCVSRASFIGCVIAIMFTVSVRFCCRTVWEMGRAGNSRSVSAGTHLNIVMRTFHGDTEGDMPVKI